MRFGLSSIVSHTFVALLFAHSASTMARQWEAIGPFAEHFGPRTSDRITVPSQHVAKMGSPAKLWQSGIPVPGGIQVLRPIPDGLATDAVLSSDGLRNNGTNTVWQEFAIDNVRVVEISASLHNPTNLFAITAQNNSHPQSLGTLYSSRDGGKSWSFVASDPGFPIRYRQLWPMGPQPGLIYGVREEYSCGILNGGPCAWWREAVARSLDGGKTWQNIDAGLVGDSRILFPSAADANVLYVGTTAGVYRSANGGLGWTLIYPFSPYPNGNADLVRTRVVPDPWNTQRVILAVPGGIRISDDAGRAWRAVAIGAATSTGGLVIHPISGDHYFVNGQAALYRSTDRGETWTMLNVGSGTETANPRHAAINVAAGALYLGTNNGLLRYQLPVIAEPSIGHDMWWNPDEPGWGAILSRDEAALVLGWYVFADNAAPAWYTLTCQPMQYQCSGELMVATGPTSFTSFDATKVQRRQAGTATLQFANLRGARIDYTIAGVAGSKGIERQSLITGNATGGNFNGIWWVPEESGWGVTLTHREGQIFAVLFAYDLNGQPIWRSALCQLSNNECAGRLSLNAGTPLRLPYNTVQSRSFDVGEIRFVWSGQDEAVMYYRIGNDSGTKRIVRMIY